ncbi:MAG TPA: response regulator [Candidatus Solibacter sp.]|nr:response regulator [Candidatus Solibacter sp.]
MARKILLADDSVTAQNMGRKILADAGYEVLTVNNGSAALKKIAEAKPELIVLDVYMPGYSGLEVCQRLKETQETARIPVLLTVGKLEPFKPEEAKRVRADGFIVKPFEASELLSALSKLEDKIVPRQELSKPGRFARANAALDESRHDKTVAAEDDSGWKNRIAFPSKKKKAAEEEPADDAAIYNAVNKDLRTVVDHQSTAKAPETKPQPAGKETEDEHVRVAALVPEGLPKDVTPEEIAALAAAAAQVQGKASEAHAQDSHAQDSHAQDSHSLAALAGPTPLAEKPSEPISHQPEVSEPVVIPSPASAIEAAASSQPIAERPEEKIAAAPEAVAEAPRPEPTLEEKKIEEKQPEEKTLEDQTADAASIPAPTAADVNTALAALEPPAASAFSSVTRDSADEPAIEPATMAAAAGAHFAPAATRWTAVSVALAPEEAALSLEHEMHKAHSAFAAAEAAHTASPASAAIAESEATPSSAILSAEPKHESAAETPSPAFSAEPELSQAAATLGTAATEAITEAVRELEAVASAFDTEHSASQLPEAAAASISSTETQPAEITSPAGTADSAVNVLPEGSVVAAEPAEASVTNFAEAASTVQSPHGEEPQYEAPGYEEPRYEAPRYEEPAPVAATYEAARYEAEATEHDQTPAVESHEILAPAATAAPEPESLTQPSPITPSTIAEEPAGPELPAAETSSSQDHVPAAKSESEIAATTAAAWASWRRIRESGDGQSSGPGSRDEAAMAVAAGAEKSPEDAQPEESGEISSIVDSVLADLRPKIVAEISRKLGKKK